MTARRKSSDADDAASAGGAAAKGDGHQWVFMARFRRLAFGWRSQPAITRIKQAVAEIRMVARKDPMLAT